MYIMKMQKIEDHKISRLERLKTKICEETIKEQLKRERQLKEIKQSFELTKIWQTKVKNQLELKQKRKSNHIVM